MIQQFSPIRYDFGADQLAGIGKGIADISDTFQQKKQAEALAQSQEQFNQVFSQMASNPDTNPRDVLAFGLKNPQQFTQLHKQYYDSLSAEEKNREKREVIELKGLFRLGDPERIKKHFKDRAEAYRKIGDEEKALEYEEDLQEYEEDPEGMVNLHKFKEEAALTPEEKLKLAQAEEKGLQNKYIDEEKIQSLAKGELELQEAEESLTKKREERDIASRTLEPELMKKYDSADTEQATANSDLNQMYAIMGNISGIDPKDFASGAIETGLRKFQTMISGQEWTKDPEKMALLRTQLSAVTMSEALKAKAAGSLTEKEMQELQKAVPQEGSTAGVYSKWLEARIKLIKSVSAAEEIKKQFYLKQKSSLPAQEKFTIQVGDKKLVVNKGEDPNKLIAKIGTGLHKFAPKFTAEESTDSGANIKSFVDDLFK